MVHFLNTFRLPRAVTSPGGNWNSGSSTGMMMGLNKGFVARYLMVKGALLKKEEPVLHEFMKTSSNPSGIRADTSEGDLEQIQDWEIVLSDISLFKHNMRNSPWSRLDTVFEIGVEIESQVSLQSSTFISISFRGNLPDIRSIIAWLGNIGAIIASVAYRSKDPPHFTLGHSVVIAIIYAGILPTALLALAYSRVNAYRDAQVPKGDDSAGSYSQEKRAGLGAYTPDFRYSL
ncbi:hypothetical protein BS47DRAFT_1365790 [Hydnum rufescens UP504]|uniref:Uncharacterized protein n=1 Tax=Hydnum rufescens UP504 TaxID=1448309 RepID=A0A9P6AMP9_9AGAM|nr:hypothetical protein BS47DRAFT_1365790 [Hydnum rufescens UP504]